MSARREHAWTAIQRDDSFDAVVVGGGVNGVGVFRDLALQGLHVLLVERMDFASGCSAAPSRMIHGGLRYLENGELSLVRESLRERDALLRNAPHMVRPLPTVIPIASIVSGTFNAAAGFLGWHGKPAERGAVPIKVGLWLYDRFTRRGSGLPAHEFLGAAATRSRWPELNRSFRFSAIYHDAWISHPERLCMEMIADSLDANPDCAVLNYSELRATGDGFEVVDLRQQRRVCVHPKVVVHATGAWLNESVRALAPQPVERMIGGTKGSHLIIDNPGLHAALDGNMVYFENADRRICILFPYLGRVLAGSTDIRVDRVERTRCEEEERDYILESIRLVFPDISVDPAQIVFSYSGIRPLPESNQDFTGRIPRSHFLRKLDGDVPQFCMIGGKWTTFRAFAQQTANTVLEELGKQRSCETLDLPIGGGRQFPSDTAAAIRELSDGFGIDPARAEHLLDLYGSAARDVAEFCAALGNDQRLHGTCYTRNEVRRIAREEHVQTLADLVLRRTDLCIRGILSERLLVEISGILAEELGLGAEQAAAEVEAAITELADWHGVSREMLEHRNNMGDAECV